MSQRPDDDGSPPPSEADALEAIAARRRDWIAAINAGDPDGFVRPLTEDAVWLPFARPAISGRERIREWVAGPFAEYTYEYSVADPRVRVAGRWAVEQARFTTRARTRAGDAAPTHEGTYTLLWRFTPSDGWRVERYIDHTEASPG